MRTIEPFKKDHLDLIEFNKGTMGAINVFGIQYFKETVGISGPAFTALEDGKPFCIAGVNIIWDGLGEAWVLLAHGFERHGFFIHRHVYTFLNGIIAQERLSRVQACAEVGSDRATKWLERLGFQSEGLMRKYFNGKNYWRYARVVDNG